MDKYEEILLNAISYKPFYTNEDLRFNRNYNILFTREELDKYLRFKDDYEHETKVELPLVTFNSKKIYYFKSYEILTAIRDYFDVFISDDFRIENTEDAILGELLVSQLTSEIEGTGRLEGTNTTKRRVLEIIKNPKLVKNDEDDILIRNFLASYKFIFSRPDFNEENLFKLYNILTKDLLTDDKKIDGEYYRKSMVYISSHEGCPGDKIKECIDSLFKYVNKELNERNVYLAFIAHYYILYIHPYYDFNGRMARIVSVWVNVLSDNHPLFPKFISEAINENKNDYYKAIDNSRLSHNDLTYFLTFLFNISVEYYLVFKNLKALNDEISMSGESLTDSDLHYIKRIILNRKKGWFNYKGFNQFCFMDISRQGSLKILNKFLSFDLLISKINNKNEKIFLFNEKKLKYQINTKE
jgi:hypothetical protein